MKQSKSDVLNARALLPLTANLRPYLIAAASGFLLSLSFPDWNFDFLVWGALIPLFWIIRRENVRRSFVMGATGGLAHALTLIYWVYHVIQHYGGLPGPLALGIVLLFACYLALYTATFCSLTRFVIDRLGLPLLVVAPLIWVTLELIRSHFLTGFPWGLLGHAHYQRLHLIQISDVVGVYGITFLIVIINAAFYSVFFGEGRWIKRVFSPAVILACGLVAVIVGYGEFRLRQVEALEGTERIQVALAQGNIDQSVKWDEDHTRSTIEKYETLSKLAVEGNAQLIIWPETAIPFYYERDAELTAALKQFIKKSGRHFVLGSPAYIEKENDFHYRNRVYLVAPDGISTGYYDKVHLVPYGEYVPLKRFFPFIQKLTVAAGDFTPGTEGDTLPYPTGQLGPLICYESAFPYLSRSLVAGGAKLLVNVTNDAWFGRTGAPFQHLSFLAFRCVETRRWAVRAANTGVSAIIGPTGRIEKQSPIFRPYLIQGEVEMLDGTAVYVRYGDIFAYGCSLATMVLLMWALLTKKKRVDS